MSWQPEVDEIRRREALARGMGGRENIERQHAAGRLTVRERIDALVKGISQLFVAGPPVVERGIGQKVTKEDLGGSHIHTHLSGAVDNEVETE